MSNRKHLLAQEVQRLERVVEAREQKVEAARVAVKEKTGKDPEGKLSRAVDKAAHARHKLSVARTRAMA